MLPSSELYIGIDLGQWFSQICCVSGADRANAKAVENIETEDGSFLFPNPASLDTVFQDGKCVSLPQLTALLRGLLSALKEKTGLNSPAAAGVCLHDFTRDAAMAVVNAFENCGIPAEKVSVFSREEAFAGYVYGMPPALRDPGSMVFDYDETGIRSYFLREYRGGKNCYITVKPMEGRREVFGPGALGRESLPDMEEPLAEFFNESLKAQNCAAVYLTGSFFDTDQFPEALLKKLCTGRRVFAGQNLYVKGACLLAADRGELRLFGRSIPAMKNRITAGVSVLVLQNGQSKEMTLAKQGESYLKADRTCYFMEEGAGSVSILVRDREKEAVPLELSLAGFPARDDRSVRLKLSVHFPGTDRVEFEVSDDGFGSFYPSTGRSVSASMQLDETRDENQQEPDTGVTGETSSARPKENAWFMPAGRAAAEGFEAGPTDRPVWSLEELGYYIYHSIYLIENDFISEKLIQFLNGIGQSSLAANLMSQKKSGAPLSKSLSSILAQCGLYTPNEISRLSVQFDSLKAARPYERLNLIAENLIVNDCLKSAGENLRKILAGQKDTSLPDSFYGRVWHNLGIVNARNFLFDRASDCFEKAYSLNRDSESAQAASEAAILAKGSSYVSAKAEDPEDVRSKKAISTTRENARYTAQFRLLEQIEQEKDPGKPEEYYSRMGEFLEELKDSYMKLTN